MGCSMSEGMSPILTSNQSPEQRAPKRTREDSDSSGSTGRARCRYQGRGKRTRRGRGELCRHAYKNLADDVGAATSSSVQHQMDGVCMLPSCNLEVGREIINFCTTEHFDEYFHSFDRFCREKCEDRSYARRGLSSLAENSGTSDAARVDEKGPSSEENLKRSTSQEASEQDVHEKLHEKRGYHGKAEVLTECVKNCLKRVVLHLNRHEQLNRGTDASKHLQFRDLVKVDPGGKFSAGIDVYKYHPWELNDSNGDKARYILVMYDSSKQRTKRTTKELCSWRQSSGTRKVLNLSVIERYLTYECRGKNGTSYDHPDGHIMSYRLQTGRKNSMWAMHEYYLSKDAIKKLTGGLLPRYQPKIYKILQNNEGTPVRPPTRQDKETPSGDPITEDGNAGVSLGTTADRPFCWEEMVTSSTSLNDSPHSDLPRGGEMGSSSKETPSGDPITEDGNAGVSLPFTPEGSFLSEDMVTFSTISYNDEAHSDPPCGREMGFNSTATLGQDGTTVSHDFDSLNFDDCFSGLGDVCGILPWLSEELL